MYRYFYCEPVRVMYRVSEDGEVEAILPDDPHDKWDCVDGRTLGEMEDSVKDGSRRELTQAEVDAVMAKYRTPKPGGDWIDRAARRCAEHDAEGPTDDAVNAIAAIIKEEFGKQ